MSYSWVTKYLSSKFKDSLQSEKRVNAVARCTTASANLMNHPEDALEIRTYMNTGFVNIMLKKPLYNKIEEKAKELETTPDALLYNAIMLILKTRFVSATRLAQMLSR